MRQPIGRKAEPTGAHQDTFRPRFRRQHGRREYDTGDVGPALGEIGDDALEIVKIAQHRDAADRLSAIGA